MELVELTEVPRAPRDNVANPRLWQAKREADYCVLQQHSSLVK